MLKIPKRFFVMELILYIRVMLLAFMVVMQSQYQSAPVKTPFQVVQVEKLLMMTKILGRILLISFIILFVRLMKSFVSANVLSVAMKSF
jgi:hypothetical protein